MNTAGTGLSTFEAGFLSIDEVQESFRPGGKGFDVVLQGFEEGWSGFGEGWLAVEDGL